MKRWLWILAGLACACAAPRPLHSPVPASVAPAPVAPQPSAQWRLTPDAPFRASEPPASEMAYFVPPRIERRTLANGIPVFLLARRGPRIASFVVAAVGIPDDKGVSRAMSRFALDALGLGAGDLTQSQLLATEAAILARRTHGQSMDGVYIHTAHLSKNTEQVIDLDADMLIRPTFPIAKVEWLKGRVSLQANAIKSSESVALDVLQTVLYGADHFMGQSPTLSAEEVSRITRDSLLKAYKATFVPGKIALIVAGDVDATKLLPKLDSTFGTWKAKRDKKSIARPEPARPATSARLIFVDRPGSSHASIAYGHIGPAWSAPDFASVSVAQRYVGALSFGPIVRRLRDELHLTYDGTMSLWTTKEPGILSWKGRVPRDGAAQVLTEIDKALGDLRAKDMPASELTLTKQRTRLWSDDDLDTAEDLSDIALALAGLECDESEPARFQDRVEAVTTADIRRVAQTWFDTSRWQAVVVGDWSAMRESLVKLGWGPIEIRDDHGKLVRIEK